MRADQAGGTKMYCPKCKAIQVCAGLNPSVIGKSSGQRFYRTDHPDINWFRRARECQKCNHTFLTAEMNEEFLKELVQLRDALKEVKTNAEQYITESSAASESLAKLTKSLSVLRALNVYKSA